MPEPTKPKVISPEVKALRDDYKQRLKDLKKTKRSAAVLKTIIEKRLNSLTMGDRERLTDALAPNTTPAIPALHTPPVVLPSQVPKRYPPQGVPVAPQPRPSAPVAAPK